MNKKISILLTGIAGILIAIPVYAQIKNYPHLRKDQNVSEVKVINAPFDASSEENVKSLVKAKESSNLSNGGDSQILGVSEDSNVENQLPYFRPLITESDFAEFTVIDGNNDQKTWNFNSNYGTNYTCSSSRAADDWLVSPAIRLESGKVYNFNIKAKCGISAYTEKFEVKASTTLDQESLNNGIVILPSTDVTSEDFKSFGNMSVMVNETDDYYIGVHAISKSNQFVLSISDFLIEEGAELTAPAAVSDFKVTPFDGELGANISFVVPSFTVGGDALEDNDIVKIEVTRDGNVIGNYNNPLPGSQINLMDEGNDLTIGNHKYQAISYGKNGIGGKSEIVEVFLTKIFTVPTLFDLTDNNEFLTFKVIDVNGDNKTWEYNPAQGAYYSNGSMTANDYLVSSGIKLEAGKKYKVTVVARCNHELYPEIFQVKMGKQNTIYGLTSIVIPSTEVSDVNFSEFTGDFTADDTDVYYLGLQVSSKSEAWIFTVNSINIEQYADTEGPEAPSLSVTPDAAGELKASVSVIAPKKSITGSEITDNLDSIDLYRNGKLIHTWTSVLPGSSLSFTDVPAIDGSYFYYAYPYNANGVGERSEKVTVFVGQDSPASVENVTLMTETATTITLSWDPVKGKTGNYINHDNVKYDIVSLKVEYLWDTYPFFVEDEILGTVMGKTVSTVNYPVDKGEQDYKYFGIKATVCNNESDPTTNVARVYVGAPYELPIEETFENGYLYHIWFQGAYTSLGGSNDGVDDRYALALYSSNEEDPVATLESGKVNLNNSENAMLIFDAKRGSSMVDKITIYNISPEGIASDIETVTLGNNYQTFKIKLPESIKYERWNRIGFKVEFEAPEKYVIIDNIRLINPLENNLALYLDAPESVKAGEKASIKATVKNIGEKTVEDFTLTVKVDNNTLFEETVTQPLNCYNQQSFNIDLPTTLFDSDKTKTVSAAVIYNADQDMEDNEKEAIIEILGSSAAAPQNVSAMDNEDGSILVNWTEPDLYTELFIENVESYSDFSTGGLDKDTHIGKIGEWTVYDGNQGLSGYVIDNVTIPSLGKNNAWIVMNPSSSQNSQNLAPYYTPYSGKKFFLSSCVSQPENNPDATDHWLISPELPGISQEVSFMARELTTEYGPEKVEVLYSMTDKNPESFLSLSVGNVESETWEKFAYTLPEGAKYFAIRHISRDIFILFIDDIAFSVNGGDLVKYNLYLDEVLVASFDDKGEELTVYADALTENTSGLNHTIENVTEGNHHIAVTAVFANGKESSPNADGAYTDIITKNTGIINALIENHPVDVYSIDGKLVRRQATSLEGLKGIYVVGGKKINIR